jgi:hypothetical protein
MLICRMVRLAGRFGQVGKSRLVVATQNNGPAILAEETLRAQQYGFLARLLAAAPSDEFWLISPA